MGKRMSKILRSKSKKGKATAKDGENPENRVNNPGCSTDLGRRAAEKHGPGFKSNCGYQCIYILIYCFFGREDYALLLT